MELCDYIDTYVESNTVRNTLHKKIAIALNKAKEETKRELAKKYALEQCECCGKFNRLVVHHWYELQKYDNNPPLGKTGWGVDYWKYYCKKVCLSCNARLLPSNFWTENMLHFINKVNTEEGVSHVLPNWTFQKHYINCEFNSRSFYRNDEHFRLRIEQFYISLGCPIEVLPGV